MSKWLLASVLMAVATVSVTAKAPTVRLTVSGPGLPSLVETIESEALANVWTGTFIGAPTVAPDASLGRYVVSFYAGAPASPARAAYVIDYVINPGGRDVIYLPGRDDARWRANVATILRSGQDGQWHFASPAWSAAIRQVIANGKNQG